MIKLTRKTEYALLAVRYLYGRPEGHVASVKDISEHYQLPNVLLAKVMQKLKRHQIVSSIKGVSGGYRLFVDLERVSLLEFLTIFEDATSLVDCQSTNTPNCQQFSCCDIRDPMSVLNSIIQEQLKMLSVKSLFTLSNPNPNLIAMTSNPTQK